MPGLGGGGVSLYFGNFWTGIPSLSNNNCPNDFPFSKLKVQVIRKGMWPHPWPVKAAIFSVLSKLNLVAIVSDQRESQFFLKFHFSIISISLLDLDFKSFLFHFHFSKRVKGEKISPFFSKKRVKFDTKFHKKINHSRRVQNPKQSTSGIIFKFFQKTETF